MSAPQAPPVALTIAGSDCSSGAGIQADLKTFTAHGVYGLTALTCVVAEVPGKVASIQPVDLAVLRQQIDLSLRTFPVAALKTGMLLSRSVIDLVADLIGSGEYPRPVPRVIDPVMVASSGDPLLEPDAIEAYTHRLFPIATLVTPNVDEARALLGGREIRGARDLREAGRELSALYHTAFLMKGGHLGGDTALDLLCMKDGTVHEYRAPFKPGISTHGTGCTYSAAITAELAKGIDLPGAVGRAKDYITRAVHHFFRWRGRSSNQVDVDALNHWERAS